MCAYQMDTMWDHPRTCGEKLYGAVIVYHPLGSPPHMRGKVAYCLSYSEQHGITPAHAGKRLLLNNLKRRIKDHPRTCGEKA